VVFGGVMKYIDFKNNSLMSKKDYEELLSELTIKATKYLSKGNSYCILPNYFATEYSDKDLGIETFSRLLWGVGPYSKSNSNEKLVKNFINGIINGTDGEHEEYWGEVKDYNQALAEMPPIALFLFFSKSFFWDNINGDVKDNISKWLLQCNTSKTGNHNWVFFSILVNASLRSIGAEYEKNVFDTNFKIIDSFYLGNGWYSDGNTGRVDYYASFAFQFYSLIYLMVAEKYDTKRCEIIRERAIVFSKSYINWFSSDGDSIPFGRSLIYRYAQIAFWGALVVTDVRPFELGVIKGIINRNLRWWLEKPIFNSDGTLSIGYSYPNYLMSESYNGSGSPYWAFKSFIILALDEKHDFWRVLEKPLPTLDSKHNCLQSKMVICRSGNHVVAFSNGQSCPGLVHSSAKYSKFVYSNIFGFSIPRSNYNSKLGAFDSTIAISENGKNYIERGDVGYKNTSKDNLMSVWKPALDVIITTILIPDLPWHIRIHKVVTKKNIIFQEGGFSVEDNSKDFQSAELKITKIKNGSIIINKDKISGLFDIVGKEETEVIELAPNTNLLYARTKMPVIKWKLKPGNHLIVVAILSDVNDKMDFTGIEKEIPRAEIFNNILTITLKGKIKKIDIEKDFKVPSVNYLKKVTKAFHKNIRRIIQ
jgi:hypothetical protein